MKTVTSGRRPRDWPLSTIFTWLDIRGCQDSNGDGIGDIPGLISRLDHFRTAGIGAFLFPGMQPTDFAYGGTMVTADRDVDPRLGTLADAERLIEEAHARDIRIILGWMPFSTHPDHLRFKASRDPDHPDHAKYRDSYLWASDINSRQPRRMGHWEWDEKRRAYYHTVWLTTDRRWCPEVNLVDLVAREEHDETARFWLDRGVDGFWVDCGVWGGFTTETEHVEFSRHLTDLVHSYGATWIISEGSKSIGETIVRDGYDSFFADQGRKVPVYKTVFRTPEQGQFVEVFEGQETQGIHEALMSFYDDPSGHQVMQPLRLPRSVDPADREALARTKLAFLIHATLPLVPILQFPHHLGLAREKAMEFVNTRPVIPLWEAPSAAEPSTHGGFTTGTPFLPMDSDEVPRGISVSEQSKDDESLLSFVTALYELRRQNRALWAAPVAESYAKVVTGDERNCHAYLRKDPSCGQVVLVAVNLSEAPSLLPLRPEHSAKVMSMLENVKKPRGLMYGGVDAVGHDPSGHIEFDGNGVPATVDLPGCGYLIAELVAPAK